VRALWYRVSSRFQILERLVLLLLGLGIIEPKYTTSQRLLLWDRLLHHWRLEAGVALLLTWSSSPVLGLEGVQGDLLVLLLTCCRYCRYRYHCLNRLGLEVVPVPLSSWVSMGTLLVWWLSPSQVLLLTPLALPVLHLWIAVEQPRRFRTACSLSSALFKPYLARTSQLAWWALLERSPCLSLSLGSKWCLRWLVEVKKCNRFPWGSGLARGYRYWL